MMSVQTLVHDLAWTGRDSSPNNRLSKLDLPALDSPEKINE